MFDTLAEAIDGLALLSLDTLRGDDIRELETLSRRFEAFHVAAVARFAAGGEWALDGESTAGAWQRKHLGVDPGEANQRARISRRLEDRKLWAEAFEDGRLSRAHLQALIVGTRFWPADVLDVHEEHLLEAALSTHPSKIALELQRFESQFMPEITDGKEDRAHDNRGVTLSTSAHGVKLLRGDMDTLGGAVVETAIQALAAPCKDDTRTAAQRRHDALVAVCQLALDQGLIPTQNGRKPHVVVTVGLETLAGEPDLPAAEVNWHGPVSRETLLRVCCDAAITRVVLDPAGVPVDVGRTMRLAPMGLRRALEVRDKGCVHPGCDMPVEWTEVHHLQHWADGGETTLANTALGCDRHHDYRHRKNLIPTDTPRAPGSSSPTRTAADSQTRDRLYFDELVGISQHGDTEQRARRRVRREHARDHVPRRHEVRPGRTGDVHRRPHDVAQPRTHACQRKPEVAHDLCGLPRHVPDGDDATGDVQRTRPRGEHERLAAHHRHVRVRRLRQPGHPASVAAIHALRDRGDRVMQGIGGSEQGYLEARRPDAPYPLLTLGFRHGLAVVHCFRDADSASLLAGDGSLPRTATVEVLIMDELATFTGDVVMSLPTARGVLAAFIDGAGVRSLGTWHDL